MLLSQFSGLLNKPISRRTAIGWMGLLFGTSALSSLFPDAVSAQAEGSLDPKSIRFRFKDDVQIDVFPFQFSLEGILSSVKENIANTTFITKIGYGVKDGMVTRGNAFDLFSLGQKNPDGSVGYAHIFRIEDMTVMVTPERGNLSRSDVHMVVYNKQGNSGMWQELGCLNCPVSVNNFNYAPVKTEECRLLDKAPQKGVLVIDWNRIASEINDTGYNLALKSPELVEMMKKTYSLPQAKDHYQKLLGFKQSLVMATNALQGGPG